ncbi:MAG: DUF1835 domain-containing protein [Chitinophagales bacterium]|nr:DUF1835 domain-containing protein [Hyphomicrobiales bacterium]
MARLIITNGESAADRMREAGVGQDILCWRDILHEGPAPQTDTLEALSSLRAAFLAERGWSDPEQLASAFSARDAAIRAHARFETILIWLEHDLYDQLQLLQILDFFASETRRDGLFIIQSGRHLGAEKPAALKQHLRLMEKVTPLHLDLARMAWQSFRASSPRAWAALLHFDLSIFPFLRSAILRQLEELPSVANGLTSTELSILKLIQEGRGSPQTIHAEFNDREDAPFMGDWSFWHILDQLGMGYSPLITGFNGYKFSPQISEAELAPYLNADLRLTNLGQNALRGMTDASKHRRIDRWMGGVHLTNANLWRWDASGRRLTGPS